MDECIICMNEYHDDFITLECCKKNIHLVCLNKWIEVNFQNKIFLKNCLHCKQNNIFIKQLSNYNNNINTNNNTNSININNNINNIINSFNNLNNPVKKIILILISIAIILTVFLSTFFPVVCILKINNLC